MIFDGNFSLLPITSEIRYGSIPQYPTASDFHMASTCLAVNENDPAAHWRIEAIRERRMNPGRSLDEAMREINIRVASRLFDSARSEA